MEGLAGDLSEAVDSESRKAKDLNQEAREVPVNGGDVLSMAAVTMEGCRP